MKKLVIKSMEQFYFLTSLRLTTICLLLLNIISINNCKCQELKNEIDTQCKADAIKQLKEFINSHSRFVQLKDLDSLMLHYSDDRLHWKKEMKFQYKNWFTEYDSLVFNETIVDWVLKDNIYNLKIKRFYRYYKNGESYQKPMWYTYSLKKSNSGLQIINIKEADIASIANYNIHTSVLPDSGIIYGNTQIDFIINSSNINSLSFALNKDLIVRSVKLNGKNIAFIRFASSIIIDTPFRKDKTNTITIQYDGKLYNSWARYGLYLTAIDSVASFSSYFADWYPAIQTADPTAPAKIVLKVPKGLMAIANGKLSNINSNGQLHVFTYESDVPSSYTFVVGNYEYRKQEIDGIVYGTFFLKNSQTQSAKRDKHQMYCNGASQIISFLKDSVYGIYPYNIYYIVEIPDSRMNSGVARNEHGIGLFASQFLGNSSFDVATFSHEIGHNYWGNWVKGEDYVTTEALANVSYALFIEHLWGEKSARNMLRMGNIIYPGPLSDYFLRIDNDSAMDCPVGIYDPDYDDIANSIAITKGCYIFMMLKDLIGEDQFRELMIHLVKEFAHKRIYVDDLVQEIINSAPAELHEFVNQWFYRTGAPEVTLDYSVLEKDTASEVSLIFRQKAPAYKLNVDVVIIDSNRKTNHQIFEINDTITEAALTFGSLIDTIIFDPDYRLFRWSDEFKDIKDLYAAQQVMANNPAKADSLFLFQIDKTPNNLLVHIWRAYFLNFNKREDDFLRECEYIFKNSEIEGQYEMLLTYLKYYAAKIYLKRNNLLMANKLFLEIMVYDKVSIFSNITREYLIKRKWELISIH